MRTCKIAYRARVVGPVQSPPNGRAGQLTAIATCGDDGRKRNQAGRDGRTDAEDRRVRRVGGDGVGSRPIATRWAGHARRDRHLRRRWNTAIATHSRMSLPRPANKPQGTRDGRLMRKIGGYGGRVAMG